MKTSHIKQKAIEKRTIVFTGGGTGGHVFPGIALLQSLVQPLAQSLLANSDSNNLDAFAWIGSEHGSERQFVENSGIEFFGVKVGKLRRYISIKNLFDPFNIFIGIIQARKILKKMRPKVLVSIGGFVSVTSVLAAALLRIPIVSISCDMTLGLATKIGLPFSSILLCSYEETAQHCCQSARVQFLFNKYQKKKRKRLFSHIASDTLTPLQLCYDSIESWCIGIGNPIRKEVYNGNAARINALYEIHDTQKVILFLGGSKGASQINEMVLRILPSFDETICIVHQTGFSSTANTTGNLMGSSTGSSTGNLTNNLTNNMATDKNDYVCKYIALDFITDEYANMLARADVVIARAGAGTLWEIVANEIPSGIIPLSKEISRGDQIENTAYFAKHNMVMDLGTHPTDTEVISAIQKLSEDERFITSIQTACKTFDAQSAAERIAKYISIFL